MLKKSDHGTLFMPDKMLPQTIFNEAWVLSDMYIWNYANSDLVKANWHSRSLWEDLRQVGQYF